MLRKSPKNQCRVIAAVFALHKRELFNGEGEEELSLNAGEVRFSVQVNLLEIGAMRDDTKHLSSEGAIIQPISSTLYQNIKLISNIFSQIKCK